MILTSLKALQEVFPPFSSSTEQMLAMLLTMTGGKKGDVGVRFERFAKVTRRRRRTF